MNVAPLRRNLPRSEAQKKRHEVVNGVSMNEVYRAQYRQMHSTVIKFMISITVSCFLAVLFFLICLVSVLGYVMRPDTAFIYVGTVAIVMMGLIVGGMIAMTLNFMRRINPALKSWSKERAYRMKFAWAGAE